MTETFSCGSSSQDELMQELILSMEHCADMTPETPRLSFQAEEPSFDNSVMDIEDFVLSEDVEQQGQDQAGDMSIDGQKRRVGKRIVKRKKQNIRQKGKVSL